MIAITGLLLVPKSSFAENFMEYSFPEVAVPTQQASVDLLGAATNAIQATSAAERGNYHEANSLIASADNLLNECADELQSASEEMRDRKIDNDVVPTQIAGVPIAEVLSHFDIPRPETTGDLIKIESNEISAFRFAIENVHFGRKAESRVGVFRLGEALQRLLDVGVIVSTLADGASG